MAKKPAKEVYFKIDGEWLSDFARTRVLEGAWERALNMLVKDVNCTHEQAIKILKGEANFTGTAEIGNPKCPGLGWKDLSPKGKVAKQMQKALDRMYGGVFMHGNKYWKPYAIVRGWFQEDYNFAFSYRGSANIENYSAYRTSATTPAIEERRGNLRSLYYANNQYKDMLVILGTTKFDIVDVLCEEVNLPPIWIDVPVNNTREHLWGLLQKGLILPVRGAEDEPSMDITTVPTNISKEAREDMTEEEVATQARNITAEFLEALNNATDASQLNKVEREFTDKFESLRMGSIPEEEWQKKEELHDRAERAKEAIMSKRVQEQADKCGGWLDLPLYDRDGKPFNPASIRVPKNPFIHWCLHGFRFEDYGKEPPEWEWVAGSGWKMQNDDPYHTDWMLGAGVPLKETYDRSWDEEKQMSLGTAVRNASFGMRSKIVEEWTGVPFVILASCPDTWVGGEIVHPKPNEGCPPGSIAVVPHAGPEYQLAMETACKKGGRMGSPGLVICETGGQLAHLAIVGREMKCTVLMVPDALKKYKPGKNIYVNMKEKKITEHL